RCRRAACAAFDRSIARIVRGDFRSFGCFRGGAPTGASTFASALLTGLRLIASSFASIGSLPHTGERRTVSSQATPATPGMRVLVQVPLVQASSVQALPSSQLRGTPVTQSPCPSHVSPTVQASPSSQAPPCGTSVHVDEQQSSPAVLPSSHSSPGSSTP